MTGGEDEAVAVDPAGVGRIDLESLTKEDGPDVGGSERETKMARLAGGDGVNGQTAGIAGGELEDCFVHKFSNPQQIPCATLASLQRGIFRHQRIPEGIFQEDSLKFRLPRGDA